MKAHPSASPAERLYVRVDRSGGPSACWPWTGAKNNKGYGTLMVRRQSYKAHRLAYEIKFGPIPAGLLVRHRCDNPPCCNPLHLTVGTYQDNTDDRMERGRDGAAKRRGSGNGRAKLTAEQVIAIFNDPRGSHRLSRVYGVGRTAIDYIKSGKSWVHVTGAARLRELEG